MVNAGVQGIKEHHASRVKEAQYIAYWNDVVQVQNRFNAGPLKASAKKDRMTPALKGLAAIEPPDELVDAHAALIRGLREARARMNKDLPIQLKRYKAAMKIFDIVQQNKALNEVNAILQRTALRINSAWARWQEAALAEAKRLGMGVTPAP